MKTLPELVSEMKRLGDREAVVYHDGLRTRRWTYRALLRHVAGASQSLDAHGLAKGDRLLLWGENRPEWLAVFWAAVLRGAVVVPVDFRSSPAFAARVAAKVEPRLVACGTSVDAAMLKLPELAFADVHESDTPVQPGDAAPDDMFQVLFTSGTTGEPKGVVHRHRNLVPTLEPIRREMARYAVYARPFQPIRFLDLLPLSHVFGQFAGLFLPVAIGGSVVFMKEIHPAAIMAMVKRERVSVLVTVPRFLTNLRSEVERRFPRALAASDKPGGLVGGLIRWLRHRDVHTAFGFKFWAILSGGARLALEDESFWARLGFVVVQGYGLTETTTFVSTNHPFHPKRGSLGKTVGPQEVKLAPDGEILVRGDNVSLELYGDKAARPSEWLATGDIGELGIDGTLFYKGRKKDVIVGAEGMNVYPVDVEAALLRQPEVKEAVVIGRPSSKGEIVHAVLLLHDPDGSSDASAAVARANETMEAHQRVREHTIWPDEDFPRTPSTFKIRRNEVAAVVGARASTDASPTAARAFVARLIGASERPRGELEGKQRLSEDLGLTSLDRIELLSELEQHYGVALSEATVAEVETLDQLENLVRKGAGAPPPPGGRSPLSGIVRIARTAPARAFRFAFRETVILPLFRHYVPLRVEGSLEGIAPPVIFAPNHTSNLDTLALLASLPRPFRDRLAPAASQEYFRPYLDGTGSLGEKASLAFQFWLGALALNVFPLPQSPGGVLDALRFAGRMVDEGYSILLFPEGRRTPDGKQHPFYPGVGMLAVRLRIPVVPVRLEGLYAILPVHETWPTPGPARLRFGAPLRFGDNEDYREATRVIERAVTDLEKR